MSAYKNLMVEMNQALREYGEFSTEDISITGIEEQIAATHRRLFELKQKWQAAKNYEKLVQRARKLQAQVARCYAQLEDAAHAITT